MCSKQGSTSRRSRREFGSDGTEWGWPGLDVHCLGVVTVWPIPDNLSIPAVLSPCIYNELKVCGFDFRTSCNFNGISPQN